MFPFLLQLPHLVFWSLITTLQGATLSCKEYFSILSLTISAKRCLYHFINASFIAAILTIVGYSINDTIVIFDRIRENLKNMRKTSFENVANLSISQTVSRSINTSVTTLLTITTLFILGGETIKDFTLALIVGVSAGTYSSIFIASPLWSIFRGKSKTAKA